MGDKSVAVYMFAQTVGVRPRQKSAAQRVCFCPQCAVSLAMALPEQRQPTQAPILARERNTPVAENG